MLNEKQIKLVVTSAMSKYAAENNGKRGISKDHVVMKVVEFGGDESDVRAAMVEGIKQVAPGHQIVFS
jgi:hypothetical protein